MTSTTFEEHRVSVQAPKWLRRLNRLETTLRQTFRQITPRLPRPTQDKLVLFYPYVAIILVTFYFPFSLINLFSSLGGVLALDVFGFVAALASLLAVLLVGLSIPGLFKKYAGAWKLNFYASLFAAATLVNAGSFLALLLQFGLFLAGWYVLFQLHPRYRY